MNQQLADKLKGLPKGPGIYYHKDAKGQIIYIGKAAVLRNRVRQYFQASRNRDPKTEALVAEIADFEWQEVETELDALFLEAEMIRRYLPRYNILLRDDKSLTYVRVNYKDLHPTVTLTRRPLDDKAQYFGPFFSAYSLRRALKYLRRVFPYSTHGGVVPKRACLQYHLGLCPGLEQFPENLDQYRQNLKKLMRYLKGERTQLMNELKQQMKKAAAAKKFEEAAQYRNQWQALENLRRQIVFSDREFLDISKDKGLTELAAILRLPVPPKRIEGYDISHQQGSDTVASMVVFSQGMPDKAAYRKFKMRLPGNDDFAHMNEVITRRFREENAKKWGRPELLLIDGGKGQLQAAIAARDKAGITTPAIGLAKREETIVTRTGDFDIDESHIQKIGGWQTVGRDFTTIHLPQSAHLIKLLQRIRDESHRFAVSYHSVLKTKRQTSSLLEDVPTIGPGTRKKLIKTFGSLRGVQQARQSDIEKAIGVKKATVLKQYLRQ